VTRRVKTVPPHAGLDPGVPVVEEVRDGRVQAVHLGHAVLLRGDGTRVAWGDADTATWWRSAPKPLQALPFARRALDEFALAPEDLALACASHNGEPQHADRALGILTAAGLDADALQCGGHPPMAADHGSAPPGGWSALHNNCSGKHAAMLAACVANGWDTVSYLEPEHPLQRDILASIARATGVAADAIPLGTDGCGAPTFWLPISTLARAYQWLRSDATGRRCLDAMAAHPWWVAGTDRFCTAFMRAARGDVVGKVGAVGVYVALHVPSGDALAVKVTGGSTQAAETFVAAVARAQGWLDVTHDGRDVAADDASLAAYADRRITTWRGTDVGRFRARMDGRGP
jgi:L-asparaginase II